MPRDNPVELQASSPLAARPRADDLAVEHCDDLGRPLAVHLEIQRARDQVGPEPQPLEVAFPQRLEPDGLPDAGRRGVEDAFGCLGPVLLAAGQGPVGERIVGPDHDDVAAAPDGPADVDAERAVAALVARDLDVVDPDRGPVVDGAEVHEQAVGLGRLERAPVPDRVTDPPPDPGQLCLGAEGDDDGPVKRRRRPRAELPLAVQALPGGPPEVRPRVLGSGSHGASQTAAWIEPRRTFALRAIIPSSVGVRRHARHVSVKDVAARSGVSFQTTSKVLNGKGSVSDVTRARILQVASDLGYVPNLQARSLVMQRTLTVGLIASDFSDHNLSRFIVGAEQEARRQGYGVIITSIEPEGSGTEYALPAMMERRVDGILLAAPQMEDDRALAHVLDRTLPVVSLHHVPGGGVATVGSDHELTGYLATQHLTSRGHRVIASVTGTRGRRVTQSRLRGYRRALEEAGVDVESDLVDEGAWEIAQALAATLRCFERRRDITAVFAHNDVMAIGVLSALGQMGRRVPDDCSVVGCDDIDMAAYTSPPLTTVHVPFYETGAEAMRLLLSMVKTNSVVPKKVLLPVHLIVRGSTAEASRTRFRPTP